MGLYRKTERPSGSETSLEDIVALAALAVGAWDFWQSKREDIKTIGEEAVADFIKQPVEVTAILESTIAALGETVLDRQIERLEEKLGIRDKRDRRLSSIEEKSERLRELIEKSS